jgi:fatty acid desaturase
MDDIVGFLAFAVFVGLLAAGAWVVINFWPVLLILAVVGVVALIAHAYEPPPDPRREIQEAEQEAKQAINSAGKAYRKRVDDLTK